VCLGIINLATKVNDTHLIEIEFNNFQSSDWTSPVFSQEIYEEKVDFILLRRFFLLGFHLQMQMHCI